MLHIEASEGTRRLKYKNRFVNDLKIQRVEYEPILPRNSQCYKARMDQ